MITIKTKNYNTVEKIALSFLIPAMMGTFASKFCKSDSCEHCDYKQLCRDLLNAHDYIIKLSREVDENE